MAESSTSTTPSRPKLALDRLQQVLFVFQQVFRLAAKINLRLVILVIIFNALWGFSSLPGFYLEKLILDRLVQNIGNPHLKPVIYSIGILIGLRLLIELFRSLLSNINGFLRVNLSRTFSAEIYCLMGEKMAQLDLTTLEDPEFKDRFTKVERESGQRAWGLMYPVSNLPNYLVGFFSAVGLLILLQPLISLGIIIVALPQFLIDQQFIKKEYHLQTKLAPLNRLWGWLNSYLTYNKNYMELKILNLSDYLIDRMRSVKADVLNQQYQLDKQRESSHVITYLPLSIFELSISVWMIMLVITEKITVGSFEMYLRALRSAQSNLSGLVSALLEIYENYMFVTDLVWFLNLQPAIRDQDGSIKLNNQQKYAIKFEDIWFKYRHEQPWILKNINLQINPGDRIAIVGENGAGKSTLVKLIARFYDPQKGQVLIGDHQLTEIDLQSWRNKLGILFQRFETYPFTGKESIGYGDITRLEKLSEVKQAAHKTGIDNYIESLPLKWENPLTPEFDQGVDLSIGQWQRIGIARMLFRKNADVLIMDEPTSSVDPEAEENIFNELLKKAQGKILIFVSQRFSTVRRADKILVVDQGRIIEQGSHEELMKQNSKYARLFSLQAKGYQ